MKRQRESSKYLPVRSRINYFQTRILYIFKRFFDLFLFLSGLYSLELNEQGDAAMKMALSDPHRFVLKPQREGGGNNVYGQDIKVLLESLKNKRDRTAYILMERIQPPSQLNYIVRPGDEKDLQLEESTVELGIFGVVLGDSENIILNKQAGHMMRSKLASSNEGGLMVGSGACDSPYLID